MSAELRVLVVGQRIYRAAFESLLEGSVGAKPVEDQPEVVLYVGPAWPDLSGGYQKQSAEQTAPVTAVVTLDRPEELGRAARLGVSSLVWAGAPPGELIDALRLAAARRAFCSEALLPSLLDAARAAAPPVALPATEAGSPPFSVRDVEVAQLAGQGLSNKEIARSAHMSVGSVKRVLSRVYRYLGVAGRGELRAVAEQLLLRGGVSPPVGGGP